MKKERIDRIILSRNVPDAGPLPTSSRRVGMGLVRVISVLVAAGVIIEVAFVVLLEGIAIFTSTGVPVPDLSI